MKNLYIYETLKKNNIKNERIKHTTTVTAGNQQTTSK